MITKVQKPENIIIPVTEEHKNELMKMVVTGNNQIDDYLEKLYTFYTYESVAHEYNLTKSEMRLLYHYCSNELTDSEICKKLSISEWFLLRYKESILKKMNKCNLLEIKLKLTIINTSAVIAISNFLDEIFEIKYNHQEEEVFSEMAI